MQNDDLTKVVKPSGVSTFIGRWLELVAVLGLAIVQPTLSFFSSDVASLSSLMLSRIDILLFLVILIAGPAFALIVIEVLIRLVSPKASKITHYVFVSLGFGLLLSEFARHQMNSSVQRIILAGVIGAVLAFLLSIRKEWFHSYLRILSVTSCIFAFLFVADSDVWNISSPSTVSPYEVTIKKPSRVVMVVFDELPLNALLDGNGNIDPTRYPAFAEVASGSTFFRNLSSVSPSTPYAVPAMLSGQYPSRDDGPPTANSHPDSLFTLLGSKYEMNVHQTVESLCPQSVCHGANNSQISSRNGLTGILSNTLEFMQYFAPFKTTRSPKFGIPGLLENTIDVGKSFVSSLEPAQGPRLDYVHVLIPHQPWRYFGDARDNTVAKQAEGTVEVSDRWLNRRSAEAGRQRFLLQMQTADWLLQKVIDRLKALDSYDESLLVVTADHGISFASGQPQRGVTKQNFPELMWVPLFVKQPSQVRPALDTRPAQTVDVLPTIAASLQVVIPWDVDGISLYGAPRPEGMRPSLPGSDSDKPKAGKEFLYFSGVDGQAATLSYVPWARSSEPLTDLYRLGPFANLFGHSVRSLGPIAKSQAGISLDGGHGKFIEDPLADEAPWTYVRGSVKGLSPGADLVIAVNGRVAGFSTATKVHGAQRLRFWGNLWPNAFKQGVNGVRFYSAKSENGKVVLTELLFR